MFDWLRAPGSAKRTAQQLYGSSVAQARWPLLYETYRVADTLAGRFEMLVLHVFLLLDRLKQEGEAGRKIGQALMEALFTAMDDDLREMGVGDLTVPKKMHQAASAFFGRAKAYEDALANDAAGVLEAALLRNVPASAGMDLDGAGLASYMRGMAGRLAAVPSAQLLAADFRFPDMDHGR